MTYSKTKFKASTQNHFCKQNRPTNSTVTVLKSCKVQMNIEQCSINIQTGTSTDKMITCFRNRSCQQLSRPLWWPQLPQCGRTHYDVFLYNYSFVGPSNGITPRFSHWSRSTTTAMS